MYFPVNVKKFLKNDVTQKINGKSKAFVTAKSDYLQFIHKALDNDNTSCYDVYRQRGYSMDIQLKRGFLDVCVLAAIKDEESYGYKIIKDLKPYIVLSESTLYTILKRLETADMLTVRTAEHCGRLRKYYHITALGRKRIEDFKKEWAEMMSIYRFITKEEDTYE